MKTSLFYNNRVADIRLSLPLRLHKHLAIGSTGQHDIRFEEEKTLRQQHVRS